nr:MAG TPA: hypothetical protein [Caudoviricetes sp.]
MSVTAYSFFYICPEYGVKLFKHFNIRGETS